MRLVSQVCNALERFRSTFVYSQQLSTNLNISSVPERKDLALDRSLRLCEGRDRVRLRLSAPLVGGSDVCL
jgi:hypothetical protein